jgi:N-acetylmuramoyl-L-alanine amidase
MTTDNLQSSSITRQLALGVKKIIIDPGHGGSDPGAPGFYKDAWEKDIVLKMAHKLAGILKERLKCTVLLTRSEDKRLTLEERTAIANTKRADLFISLHCNAAKNKELKGIETYFLNLATDSQAIAVAARENATSEKNISDLDYILSDLMKNAKIEESTRLANIVHKNFVAGMKSKYSDITDLGVKQAPFYVLLGARMPSILIETSFISNKLEGQRLMEDSYQKAVCESIADGIEKYIDTTNPKHL